MDDESNQQRETRERDLEQMRQTRAADLEQVRVTRAARLDQDRAERATQLAVEMALKQKDTDYRLGDHDRQLKVVNSSIEHTGHELLSLRRVIDDLAEKFAAFSADQHTRDAVARELKDAAKGTQAAAEKANEKQVSTRTFILGVIAVILTFVGLVLAQTHLFG